MVGASDPEVLWRDRVGSTQTEARVERERRSAIGQAGPFAVATDDQTGGRGRLGRSWACRPGASLALTVVHPGPDRTAGSLTWAPLVAGLAVVGAVSALLGSDQGSSEPEMRALPPLGLKWPNDIHDARGRKAGGILVERMADGTLLVGVGLNLRGAVLDVAGAEVPGAVSLGLGVDAPRLAETLAAAITLELDLLEVVRGDAVASGQADRYRETCVTLGRAVRVLGVGSSPTVDGVARRIDDHGRLVVEHGGTESAVDVGDVLHVRPAAATDDPREERE